MGIGEAPPIKVVVLVHGGVVQGARSTHANVNLEVVDYDNFDCEDVVVGETEDEATKRVEKDYPHAVYY